MKRNLIKVKWYQNVKLEKTYLRWKLVSYPFVIVNNKIDLNHNVINLQLSQLLSIEIHRDEVHRIKKGDIMFVLKLFGMDESWRLVVKIFNLTLLSGEIS